ncbi:hypothetical protein K8R33_02905 [archaeon]|nr:hypothetical protein [archaeon]
MKGFFGSVILIMGLIILVSIIDLFANSISLIPVLGDVLETMSETILEFIQIVLASLLGVMAIKKKK